MRRLRRAGDRASATRSAYVLESGSARFVLRGAVRAGTDLGRHVAEHGDGVVDLAIEVPDVPAAYAYAIGARGEGARGAAPADRRERHGRGARRSRRTARPGTRWSTAPATTGRTCPASWPAPSGASPTPTRVFQAIDHCVGNVELGHMDEWVEFYHRVMGFTNMAEFVGDDIATEYSALMSKVVADGTPQGEVPAERAGGRQAEEPDRRVPGVLRRPGRAAHRAATGDIVASVRRLREAGMEFLDTPGRLLRRAAAEWVGDTRVPLETLRD